MVAEPGVQRTAAPTGRRGIPPSENAMNSSAAHPFIKWFADTTIADIPLVGGKNASLGEMFRELAARA